MLQIDEPAMPQINGSRQTAVQNTNIPQNSPAIHGSVAKDVVATDYSQYGLSQWTNATAPQQSVVSIDDSTPYARGYDKADYSTSLYFIIAL